MSQRSVCETKVDPANGATGRHHRVPERAKRMTAVTGFSLEPHGITAGGVDWKKLVAGKKLWNFSKHEYDAWRGAL